MRMVLELEIGNRGKKWQQRTTTGFALSNDIEVLAASRQNWRLKSASLNVFLRRIWHFMTCHFFSACSQRAV